MTAPAVSVVVVNYNGAHLLPDCLVSLVRQDHPRLEVIVVDNGSLDESEAVVRGYGCRWVALGANHGLPSAYNRGAEQAAGGFLFFVNNDMRFEPECVSCLVEALGAHPEAFASDPLQWDWEGRRVIHARTVLEPVWRMKERFSRAVLPIPPVAVAYLAADEIVTVPWGCAGSLLVRREMFESLGGWDDVFFLDMEDVDLCLRAGLRGWPTLYVPRARLFHKWGASNDEHLRPVKSDSVRQRLAPINFKRLVSQQRNHLRLALKLLDPMSVAMLLGIKLASLPVLAARRPVVARALVLALTRFAREAPEVLRLRRAILKTAVCSTRTLIDQFVWNETDGGGY